DVSVTSATIALQQPPLIWTGFFDPIDNLPSVNKVNAGQSIPIKFSLGGYRGLEIFADGYPASQKASCSNWSTSGSLQEITTVGSWGNDDDDDDDYEYDHDYHSCGDKGHHDSHRHKKSSWKRDSDRDSRGGSSSDDAMKAGLKYSDNKYQLNW